MNDIAVDESMAACCGLYCAACGSHLKGRCAGCRGNAKATWCKVRTCCLAKGIATCAECIEFADAKDCGKFNNFISRAFGLLFNSDRAAGIARIRKIGRGAYAAEMAAKKAHHLPRRGPQ
jgi:hypothetical protein